MKKLLLVLVIFFSAKFVFVFSQLVGPVYNVQNSSGSCFINAPLQCLRYIPLFRDMLAKDRDVGRSEFGKLFTGIFDSMDAVDLSGGPASRVNTKAFRDGFYDLFFSGPRANVPLKAAYKNNFQGAQNFIDQIVELLEEIYGRGNGPLEKRTIPFDLFETTVVKSLSGFLERIKKGEHLNERRSSEIINYLSGIYNNGKRIRILVLEPELDARYGAAASCIIGVNSSAGKGVTYNEKIDIAPCMHLFDSNFKSKGITKIEYDLVGVVCHPSPDHFTAYVKNNRQWYYCNCLGGDTVKNISSNIENILQNEECAMLFYTLSDDRLITPESRFSWEKPVSGATVPQLSKPASKRVLLALTPEAEAFAANLQLELALDLLKHKLLDLAGVLSKPASTKKVAVRARK